MTENHVKSIELENGLTLTIEDKSRRISDDAFVVKAVFAISFPFTEGDAQSAGLTLQDLIQALGTDTGRFEKFVERNFINESKKDEVFEEITASYLKTNQAYLSHPDFKKGVVRRGLVEKRGRY